MSSITTHLPRQQPNTSPSGAPQHKRALHLGTFAEGQRAVPVTVTHSQDVGSFASVDRN